jgi:hypothetical protein
MLSKTWAALAAALTLALLPGCGNEEANSGQVRLVNATTEFATMNLLAQDTSNGDSHTVVSGTPSSSVSAYEALDKGTYTFDVIGAGNSTGSLPTDSVNITKQDHFAAVAYITGGTLTQVFFAEEEPAPGSGYAKLRILNGASTEAGGIDVYVTSHDCTALGATDTALVTNVTGLQTSFSQISVASSQTWNICATGTGNQADLRLAVVGATFANQQVSTLILTRTPGGVLLNGALLTQQGPLTAYPNNLARVRLVADATAGGVVSATVNGVQVSPDLVSPAIAPAYQAVPSGQLTMSLSIDGTAVTTTPLTATAGADYTLLVAGNAGAATIALLPDNNTPSTSTSSPVKMRLVNGLNNSASTASLTAGSTQIAQAVAFGTASAYATLPANTTGTANITVKAGSPAAIVFALPNETLDSGAVYTVFLLGDAQQGSTAGSDMITDRQPSGSSGS